MMKRSKAAPGPNEYTWIKKLVPGCHLFVDIGSIYEMPEFNPHIWDHAYGNEEVVLYIGGNPQHHEDLGGEIEFGLG